MSVFIYSYAEALQPVLNNKSARSQWCTLTSPPNPTHPCQQAWETFKNAGE